MVGQGVLRECLTWPSVEAVLVVGRSSCGVQHPRLTEVIQSDLTAAETISTQLTGYDACFFCLGVSSAGMKEPDYHRVTYDLTLAVATTLARVNPRLTFIYVSGAGTDSTEKGGAMWARVKGKTENALARLPFKSAYFFRPGFIQPLHGIKSKTGWYRAVYAAMGPFYPLFKTIFPAFVTNTQSVGLAMIRVAEKGHPSGQYLENHDINRVASGRSP